MAIRLSVPKHYRNFNEAYQAAMLYEVATSTHKQSITEPETLVGRFEKVSEKVVRFHINWHTYMIGPIIETNYPELITCISFWSQKEGMFLFADEKIKFPQPFPLLATCYEKFFVQIEMVSLIPDDLTINFDIRQYNKKLLRYYNNMPYEFAYPENAIRIIAGMAGLAILNEPIDQDLIYVLSEEEKNIDNDDKAGVGLIRRVIAKCRGYSKVA